MSKEAREAFVAIIKEENAMRDPIGRWSLQQHWTGADGGFAHRSTQARWQNFKEGWMARERFTPKEEQPCPKTE